MFCSPEKIENALSSSPYIQMSFVYGDRYRSSLVCVVVPDPDAVLLWAKDNHREGVTPIFTFIIFI